MNRERKYMSLQEAVISQQEKFPVADCFECGAENTSKLVFKPIALLGITVWDFPVHTCEKCGSISHRASVSIAVENLQEKHRLHGVYTLEELLHIEKAH